MQKTCFNCNNSVYEHAEYCECKKYDEMTEEETEKYWINDEPDCPYWE